MRYLADGIGDVNGSVVARFSAFVRNDLSPLADDFDPADWLNLPEPVVRHVRRESAMQGFYAVDYPVALGGGGESLQTRLALIEEAERAGSPLARVAVANAEGPSYLLLHTPREQQMAFLEPLIRGLARRSLAMTEDAGGSDLSGITTTALEDEDGWTLRGQKAFVSGAESATWYIVFCRAGTSSALFMVDPNLHGVEVTNTVSGASGERVSTISLHDVRVPRSARLDLGGPGPERWATLDALQRGRLIVASVGLGIAMRALTLGAEFVKTRSIGGRAIAASQLVQDRIVRARTAVEQARLLTYAAAREIDRSGEAFAHASMAKMVAADVAQTTTREMSELLGARGWVPGEMDFLRRYAMSLPVVEGTLEVQKLVISNSLGLM